MKSVKSLRARLAIGASLVAATLMLSGCLGFYDNTDSFLNPPPVGMKDVEVLKKYGAPTFATNALDQKVYVYKVRDVKYIILIGLYNGYDLVVSMRDGHVEETMKVQRPSTFTLFQPIPWAVAD